MKYNQSGFQVTQKTLTLSHKHPSKIKLAFSLVYLPQGRIKQVDRYHTPTTKEWWVSFICEVEVLPYVDNGLYQAFDPGVDQIVAAVNSQGKTLLIPNRRPDKYWKPQLAEVQAKRDRCKKNSWRWRKYHRKLRRMQRKSSNQIKDFQHWVSNKIVKNIKANTLIFGKPEVKRMAQHQRSGGNKATRTLHYALQNTGSISRFIELVTYKAQRKGKKVILVDEAYSTQVCPCCGTVEPHTLDERFVECVHCGFQADRDLAASINIMARFYLEKDRYEGLCHEPSVNEELFFQQWKGLLRHTAQGKTKVSLSSYWARFGGLAVQILIPHPRVPMGSPAL